MEWKEKINDEGSNPPEHLWGIISTGIADIDNKRLYDLEFDPPTSCWEHIHSQISKPKSTVLGLHPSYFMRYAAILIFAFFTSLLALSPSFRATMINAVQGNKIKAALPSTNQLMDSMHVNKTKHMKTQSK